MTMRFDAVFFDLDGTLLDTSAGVIKAIDHIAEIYHLPVLSLLKKRSFIGPPIQDSFQLHYGLSKEQAWELATAWRDAYKDLFLLEAEPYEGIYDVLRFCREYDIKTGVATNKREDYTKKLLDHFGFTPLFDYIAGTDFDGRMKKADLIRACMEKVGISNPEKCLMIGDTTGDMEAAKNAGVGFLGVTYGFGFVNGTKGKFPLVNCCSDIENYIMGAHG